MGEMIDEGVLPEEATVDAEPLLCRVLGAVVHGCGALGSRLVADIPVLVVRRQEAEAESLKDFMARNHKVNKNT